MQLAPVIARSEATKQSRPAARRRPPGSPRRQAAARDDDAAKSRRVMEAMLRMGKLDITRLKQAHEEE